MRNSGLVSLGIDQIDSTGFLLANSATTVTLAGVNATVNEYNSNSVNLTAEIYTANNRILVPTS